MTVSDLTVDAIDDVARRVDEDGWAVLPAVLSPDRVERLRTAVESTMDRAAAPWGPNRFLGHRTRRLFNLLARDPVFAEIPVEPVLLGVAQKVLDEHLLLSSLTAVETNPGQEDQPLHADDGSIPLARPHQPLALLALVALTDFTSENGATRLVPGSHRFDRRPEPAEEAETICAEMAAGSVLFYNGSIWHGGGANRSDQRRVFVVCNYCAGWLRQEENQLLGVPREQVAQMPARLRRLIGYGVHRGLQGHVDGVDPGSWFDESQDSELVWARMR